MESAEVGEPQPRKRKGWGPRVSVTKVLSEIEEVKEPVPKTLLEEIEVASKAVIQREKRRPRRSKSLEKSH